MKKFTKKMMFLTLFAAFAMQLPALAGSSITPRVCSLLSPLAGEDRGNPRLIGDCIVLAGEERLNHRRLNHLNNRAHSACVSHDTRLHGDEEEARLLCNGYRNQIRESLSKFLF